MIKTHKTALYRLRPLQRMSLSIVYVSLNWSDHLSKALDNGLGPIPPTIFRFLERKFLYWLEALRLLRRVNEGTRALTRLGPFLCISYSHILS